MAGGLGWCSGGERGVGSDAEVQVSWRENSEITLILLPLLLLTAVVCQIDKLNGNWKIDYGKILDEKRKLMDSIYDTVRSATLLNIRCSSAPTNKTLPAATLFGTQRTGCQHRVCWRLTSIGISTG